MIQCVSGASAAIQEREEFCMTREKHPNGEEYEEAAKAWNRRADDGEIL